jgi:predicted permease
MMAIICLYFQFLPTNMPWVQEILLIQSAMPAGIFAVVIVGNYGGDKLTALRTIPVTMIWVVPVTRTCFGYFRDKDI